MERDELIEKYLKLHKDEFEAFVDEDELSDFSVENEKTISTEYMICEKDHNDGWVGKVEVRYIE